MNIILFFGSFNPIHLGHLILAQEAALLTNTTEVWLVLSPQNPFKNTADLLDEKVRLQILQKTIAHIPILRASDIEFDLPKPSYTIQTLESLQQIHPQHHFKILIGTDILPNLHKWRNYEQLIHTYEFLVFPRNNYPVVNMPSQYFTLLPTPIIEISSTQIRDRIKGGLPYAHLVAPETSKEIIDLKCYKH